MSYGPKMTTGSLWTEFAWVPFLLLLGSLVRFCSFCARDTTIYRNWLRFVHTGGGASFLVHPNPMCLKIQLLLSIFAFASKSPMHLTAKKSSFGCAPRWWYMNISTCAPKTSRVPLNVVGLALCLCTQMFNYQPFTLHPTLVLHEFCRLLVSPNGSASILVHRILISKSFTAHFLWIRMLAHP